MATVLLEARSYRPFKSSEEYLYAMREDLAEWMNTMYPDLRINVDNFMDRLDTGVALCKVWLRNYIFSTLNPIHMNSTIFNTFHVVFNENVERTNKETLGLSIASCKIYDWTCRKSIKFSVKLIFPRKISATVNFFTIHQIKLIERNVSRRYDVKCNSISS